MMINKKKKKRKKNILIIKMRKKGNNKMIKIYMKMKKLNRFNRKWKI